MSKVVSFSREPMAKARTLPSSISVLYTDRTSGTLELNANLYNATKVNANDIAKYQSDPEAYENTVYKIIAGNEEYINNNSFMYEGGYYLLKAKVGTRSGGFVSLPIFTFSGLEYRVPMASNH